MTDVEAVRVAARAAAGARAAPAVSERASTAAKTCRESWRAAAGGKLTTLSGASDLAAGPGAVGERLAFDRLIQPQDCYVTDRVPRFVILLDDLRNSTLLTGDNLLEACQEAADHLATRRVGRQTAVYRTWLLAGQPTKK